MGDWRAVLNGAVLCGAGDGECEGVGTVVGCLTTPPVGLGVPGLRVEDQTFPQRDGVAMYADWYLPRQIVLENVTVGGGCGCGDARADAGLLMESWSRYCDDTELVLFPPCGDDEETLGPYGVRGRPRVAELTWRPGRGNSATALLRFDSVDHRLYLLDEDGTPGSGGVALAMTGTGGLTPHPDYNELVATTGVIDNHWPLDTANTRTNQIKPTFRDVITGQWSGEVNYGLDPTGTSLPSVALGRLAPQSAHGRLRFGFYGSGADTSGMFGFWYIRETDTVNCPSFRVDLSSFDNFFDTEQGEITWGGASTVLMNAELLNYVGEGADPVFGVPVFVMLAWTASNLWVYVSQNEDTPPYLVQTVAVSNMPGGDRNSEMRFYAPSTTSVRVSNVIKARNQNATSGVGEGVAEDLVPDVIPTPVSAVVPDVGNLCGPVLIEFDGGTDPILYRQDGNFVGLAPDLFGASATIDTSTGRAVTGDGQDITFMVIGDPFFQVSPGDVLTAFNNAAGYTATVTFRPSVISG